ncbi:MAG: hypothetical protein JNK56_26950, partial [Myxococcales bacterium]|nr:hypothetical protein [Myxococcales bacterium]
VPLGLEVRAGSPTFKATPPGKDTAVDFAPLAVDVVAMLPRNASLAPKPPATRPPTLLARIGLARLVTGTAVAELATPIDLSLELWLTRKPEPGQPALTPAVRPLVGLALHVGLDAAADIRLELTDASLLRATTTPAAAAARRTVTWKRGSSPVLPLVKTALLVLRSWLIGMIEAAPPPAPLPPDYTPPLPVRLRDHLLPLLEGEASSGLQPVPLAVFEPAPAALLPWLAGFLKPPAIVAVLGHLRALISGTTSSTTAPGSAIAWLTPRNNPADHARPQARDFGLVVRTSGDESHGSAGLGLRGQQSWQAANDTVRIGLVLEGDLVSVAWDLSLTATPTVPKASARARAHTGAAHLFLVVEPVDPAQALITTPVGELVRLELGVTLSTAGALPEVRITLGKQNPSTRSLGRALQDLRDAAKAEAEATVAAVKAELTQALADLKQQFVTLVADIQQAVTAYTAAVTSVLPADIQSALLDLLADVQSKATNLDPANLSLDPTRLRTLVARGVAWARRQVNDLPGALDLDLGPATLTLAADAQNLTYSAALAIKPNALPGPLPLTGGAAIDHTGALTCSASLGLTVPGLPLTAAVKVSVSGNQPHIDLELRDPGNKLTTLPLLGGSVDLGQFIGGLIQPLLAGAIKDVELVPGVPATTLLELLGLPSGTAPWQAPDLSAILGKLLPHIVKLAGDTAQAAASAVGLGFEASNLEFSFKNLALGTGGARAQLGKFAVALLDQGQLQPVVTISDLAVDFVGENDAPAFEAGFVSVGKLRASTYAALNFATGPSLQSVSLGFHDVRLPLGQGGKNDQDGKGDLMSAGKANPGLDIDLAWKPTQSPPFSARLAGGLRLDLAIDRVIGPLDVRRLSAVLDAKDPPDLALTLDASFKLGGVTIAPQGLGVTIPLGHLGEPALWRPRLDGLALAYDQSGVTLAGMLARTDTGFAGQATIRAFEFQLGALAAYDKLPGDGVASLAVFGVLKATLGGPPFFVVTGVAAGFGVNRGFERPKRTADLANNALLATMKGDKPLDLAAFRSSLPVKRGAFWLAGGVKFISYGFILGDALLYVLLDDGFELGLLALARMGIPELLQINLAIEAGLSLRGEPTLFARAALYDSWLLHRDCKITGGFALQVWPQKGDAVITLGGYHPAFKRPDHYPEVDRLGFNWAISDAIVVKGGCYFAMTPREAMGGGRLEVSGRWGPLSAGFYAGVDGLIRWDPFYFNVDIVVGVWGAVDLWFGTLRFEVGVGLHVEGPPVGGVATLKLAVFSIAIPFGDTTPRERPYLKVARTIQDHLHVALPPGASVDDDRVAWPAQALLAADASAPIRLQVVSGRGREPAPVLIGPPAPPILRLRSESLLRLALALPITAHNFNNWQNVPVQGIHPLHLALANKVIARSVLTLRTPLGRGSLRYQPVPRPLALFGPSDAAQGSAANMFLDVVDAVDIDLGADRSPAMLVTKLSLELSAPAPLPLASDASKFLHRRVGAAVPWTLATLTAAAPRIAARVTARGAPLPRRFAAYAALAEVRPARLYRGRVLRKQAARRQPHAVERPPQLLGLAYLDLPLAATTRPTRTRVGPEYAELPRIAPPAAVPRSPLCAGLVLHAVETRTRAADPPRPPTPGAPARTTAGKHPRTVRAPAGGDRYAHLTIDPAHLAWSGKTPPPQGAVLGPAELCVLDLARPDARSPGAWRFHSSGGQRLRLVALDLGHAVLADLDLEPGPQDMPLPPGTRRLALLGGGAPASPPRPVGLKDRRPRASASPAPLRGFSRTTALVALAPRLLLAAGA